MRRHIIMMLQQETNREAIAAPGMNLANITANITLPNITTNINITDINITSDHRLSPRHQLRSTNSALLWSLSAAGVGAGTTGRGIKQGVKLTAHILNGHGFHDHQRLIQ